MSAPGDSFNGDSSGNIIVGTRGDDSISGAGGNDTLYDSMGNDVVFAGDDDDRCYVCLGNDWYDGGDNTVGGDTIAFLIMDVGPDGNNLTTNNRGVVFDLTMAHQDMGYLGVKTFYGFENVIGSIGDDRIFGDGAANIFDLESGNDVADGRGGNDTIHGSLGRDVLIGGKGVDSLAGYYAGGTDEVERDFYRYVKTSDSGTTAATRDTIHGFFNGGGTTGDKIDLSRIDANPYEAGNQTFNFLTSGPFHENKNGEVRVKTVDTGGFLVRVDTDKDTGSEMTIFVAGTVKPVEADFLL